MYKIIFIYILLILIFSCEVKFKSNITKEIEHPDIVIGEFKYVSTDQYGRKEWIIKASEAKIYNNRNEVFLYNMTMTFFNESNQVKTFVSANGGYINRFTKDVFAEGKVKIVSESQSMLEANRIYWSNDIKKFYSHPNELVLLIRKNAKIYGYNLIADFELKEATLESTEGDIE